jgi:acetyl esterase/lipase
MSNLRILLGRLLPQLLLSASAMAQSTSPISPGSIPNAKPGKVHEISVAELGNRVGISKVVQPTHTVFMPAPGTVNRISAIICRGGSYAWLSIDSQGYDVAKLHQCFNELHVSAQTPPAFLVHAEDDKVVPVSSIMFCQAGLRHGVPSELHLYPRGGHGFGLNNTTSGPTTSATGLKPRWLTK